MAKIILIVVLINFLTIQSCRFEGIAVPPFGGKRPRVPYAKRYLLGQGHNIAVRRLPRLARGKQGLPACMRTVGTANRK